MEVASVFADGFSQLLLRTENLELMGATIALLSLLYRLLPAKIVDNPVAVRWAPLYPVLLCSIGVWIPGQQPADATIGSKLLLGLLAGHVCGHLYKIWDQTARGNDERIRPSGRLELVPITVTASVTPTPPAPAAPTPAPETPPTGTPPAAAP